MGGTYLSMLTVDILNVIRKGARRSGAAAPCYIGNRTVTYTAEDANGNKALCSFTATGKTDPVLSSAGFSW